jgi:hypothetical protein
MEPRFHIPGTEQFGYSMVNRYLFSVNVYMNTVKRICNLYKCASVKDLKGYVAHFCYLRLKSFDTFLRVLVEHRDYVTANCIMRMLGDSVAVFHLVYMEPDLNYRILRHALYVLDGCEHGLKVLPENSIREGSLPEDERIKANAEISFNRDHRKRLMREAQELLDHSPLKQKDEEAFNRIVEDRNWKFKEFKDYNKKKIKENQFQWRELYARIDFVKEYDLISYLSQYAHCLSMSNLVINLNEKNMDSPIGEALGLLDRMNQYVLNFYEGENLYIFRGLLEPETRDKILACYDDKHRPSIAEWERTFMPFK